MPDLRVIQGPLSAIEDAFAERVIAAREAWQASRSTLIDEQISGLRVHTAGSSKAGWVSADHEIHRGGAKDSGIAVHELLQRIELR